MKNWQTFALCSVLATTLVACSSSDDDDESTGGIDSTADGATSGEVIDDDPNTTTDGDTGDTTGDTAGDTTDDTAGDTTGGNSGDTAGDTTDDTTGGNAGDTAGDNTGGTTASGNIPEAVVLPTPRPSTDPFGFTLENDPVVSAGAPTQPKNLRADLVSRDWAEINWAPANDDEGVVSYVVDRSDGVSYNLTAEIDPNLPFDNGTFREYRRYFQTTTFMDCNITRFGFLPGSERAELAPWNCTELQPEPGSTYTYTVTAFDADGNASAASEPLEVTYTGGQEFAPSRVDDFIEDFDIVWNDEFNGDSIDPERWNTQHVFGSDVFVNGEQQYFVPVLEGTDIEYNPFDVSDGTVKINAIRTPESERAALPASCDVQSPVFAGVEGRDNCEFLSGILASYDRMQFRYGYTEARIRASDISGALSSFYLIYRYPGENNPAAGEYFRHRPEIDILEYLGENPFGDEDPFHVYHYSDVNTGITRSAPTMAYEGAPSGAFGGEFHTFGALWEPGLVIWYIDGVEVRRLEGPQIGQQPMNVINYLVAGSGWAPEPAENTPTLTMEVDYIRVYMRDAHKSSLFCGEPGIAEIECPAVQ